MAKSALVAWIGNTDLRVAAGNEPGLGPIAQAVRTRSFTEVHLLSDHADESTAAYAEWLGAKTDTRIMTHAVSLSSPMNFGEIYEFADDTVRGIRSKNDQLSLVFHLSPGTPAMAAVWILLSKTIHPAECIESSAHKGVHTVSLPFEISAEYVPTKATATDDDILKLTLGLPAVPAFDKIVHRCKAMKRVIARARRVSEFDVPVLIQGESGTGKELFAAAIHQASDRSEGPFVDVNCGAIPESLIESELFGHTAGAFTDAKKAKTGLLERAHGGTLFLDEIGELPLSAQVRLLRALQQGVVQPVGGVKSKRVDFRVVAATNRVLREEVSTGRFREDLFHRIGVAVLTLPPLRERRGDINLLIDYHLERLNREHAGKKQWISKKVSAGARNLLNRHTWPGNVRELFNTISRAAIWAADATIQVQDITEALFPVGKPGQGETVLNRSLGNGFDLEQVMAEVARHYLERALNETKTKEAARELLGFGNTTTLTNWMRRYGVES